MELALCSHGRRGHGGEIKGGEVKGGEVTGKRSLAERSRVLVNCLSFEWDRKTPRSHVAPDIDLSVVGPIDPEAIKQKGVIGVRGSDLKMKSGVVVPCDDALDEIRRDILEEYRSYLIRYLEPKSYFPYLRSASLLTPDDEELIKAEITRVRMSEKLLDILLQKGSRCFEGLVRAIQYRGTQTFLVEKLNVEFEKRKNNMNTLLHDATPDQSVQLPIDLQQLPKPTTNRVPVEHQSSVKESFISLNQSDA